MYKSIVTVEMSPNKDRSLSLDYTVHTGTGRVNLATGDTPLNYEPCNVAIPDVLIDKLEEEVTKINSEIVRQGCLIDAESKYVCVNHWLRHSLHYIYRSDMHLHVFIFTMSNGRQFTIDSGSFHISTDDFDIRPAALGTDFCDYLIPTESA